MVRRVPRLPHRPPSLGRDPFRGRDAIGAALLTPAQLRSSAWRRVFYDVYVDARSLDSPTLRIKAAALRLPTGAIITGRSAAHLLGAELASIDDAVEILTPTRMRPQPGLAIRCGRVAPNEIVRHRDVPTSTPLHTAWEIARAVPLLDAIGWIDALARRRHLSGDELVGHGATHSNARGSRRAAETLALCDGRAESPPESRLRVSLVLAGLPPPIPQWTVLVDGYFVARVDLAWPQWKFAIEYDGQWHADRDQLTRDRLRIRQLTAAGWYVYPVTNADMRDIPRLLADIAARLNARRRGVV
jgi:hypothetical protein